MERKAGHWDLLGDLTVGWAGRYRWPRGVEGAAQVDLEIYKNVGDHTKADIRFRIVLSVEGARELAAALTRAATLADEAPFVDETEGVR